MPTADMPMHYVNRTEWGALPSLEELPTLEHPIRYVRLTYTKDYKKCHSNKKCTKRLKDLQLHNMNELKLPDIQPNFLVAGDGYVYEGRGWHKQPEKVPDRPDLDGKFVEIAYIGDYTTKPPNNQMLRLSWLVIEIGTDNKYVDKDFQMLELGGPVYTKPRTEEPIF